MSSTCCSISLASFVSTCTLVYRCHDEIHKVTIPAKPTPEGYKIWVLADGGYVLDWLFHAREIGPIDLDTFWYLIRGEKGEAPSEAPKGFSKTQSVVLDLAANLRGPSNEHIIWLDNLSTSARLLLQLAVLGFAAAGTVRTQKTAREKEDGTWVIQNSDEQINEQNSTQKGQMDTQNGN